MLTIDSYRKGWALRSLREAKAELAEARRMPYLAKGLILGALRKAQMAIYYSLGDPLSIEWIVRRAAYEGGSVQDPILRCLIGIEWTLRSLYEAPELLREAIDYVDQLVQMASDIVKIFIEEGL